MTIATELQELTRLHHDGALTADEFAAAKSRVLGHPGVTALIGNGAGLDGDRLLSAGLTLGETALRIRTIFGIVLMFAGAAFSIFVGTMGETYAYYFLPVWLMATGVGIYAPYWAIKRGRAAYQSASHAQG